MNGLRLAIGTLTAVPVEPPRRIDTAVARTAMLVAPLVGVGLAAVSAVVVTAADGLALPPLVTGVLAVCALGLITRGLHLDGLADTADGLAASYDRERALTVMRRGDVGPAGVATLVLVLVLQVTSLAAAVEAGHGPLAVGLAVLAGRAALPLTCVTAVPAARIDGLGVAVAGSVPVAAAAAVVTVVLLATWSTAAVAGGHPGLAVGAVVVGWAAAALLVARCVRRLGGVTGDVLGAVVEVATTGTLVVLSVG